jgi:micrococcal nuclease
MRLGRSRRITRKRLPLAALVVLALLVILARDGGLLRDVFRPAPDPTPGWYRVERVIDGDTLKVSPNPWPVSENGDRIRLIGVDTPETVRPDYAVEYFGREAAAFTRHLCEGRRVRLEFDPAAGQDRYGRTLAYVYLEDGTFVNAEIIRQGYGHAYTRFPFAYLQEFRALEREAHQNRRGLWAQE